MGVKRNINFDDLAWVRACPLCGGVPRTGKCSTCVLYITNDATPDTPMREPILKGDIPTFGAGLLLQSSRKENGSQTK